MKQYKIFLHPSGTSTAVKQGWSWPAFFFGFLWAIVKQQWVLGVSVFVALFVGGIVMGAAGKHAVDMQMISIAINVVFGMSGNSWREKKLISRGYEQMGTVSASNEELALALYLNEARGVKGGK
jgi:Protein of unknown function (DUF2628).